MVFVGPPSEDGEGYRVLRKREDALEVGELRAAKEGKPIHGEVVKLKQREEHERLFDVETVLAKPEKEQQQETPVRQKAGPAMVASDAYREGWDAIFAPRAKEQKPN